MTDFELQTPQDGIHWMYKSGEVTVASIKYVLGQFRLQIWYGLGEFPDILSPVC